MLGILYFYLTLFNSNVSFEIIIFFTSCQTWQEEYYFWINLCTSWEVVTINTCTLSRANIYPHKFAFLVYKLMFGCWIFFDSLWRLDSEKLKIIRGLRNDYFSLRPCLFVIFLYIPSAILPLYHHLTFILLIWMYPIYITSLIFPVEYCFVSFIFHDT